MRYIKQLDAIRAIAVLLVIVSHWLPRTHYLNKTPNGMIGVDTFFVLSGFLISNILFVNKRSASAGNRLSIIKNFMIRRTLRIFPLYYLVIIIFSFFIPFLHDHFIYFVTYTSNFLFFDLQRWGQETSHLWSLAVEEQFYLFWPWLIIFIPKKYLESTILTFIAIGVASNYVIKWLNPGIDLVHIVTPTCFDAFGLGALLAYYSAFKPERLKVFTKWLSLAALAAFMLLALAVFAKKSFLPTRTLIAVCALYAIAYAMTERKNLLFRVVLNNPVLIFIGKISYGVYIYHLFVPWIWRSFLKSTSLHAAVPARIVQQLILAEQLILLIALSWVSWKVFENPINGMKKYFNYKPASSVKATYAQPHVET